MTLIALPSSPIKWRSAALRLLRADALQEYASGATKVTVYSKAVWALSIDLPPLDGADLRAWRAALAQLSSLANTFAASPPDYSGPSTGYAGPAPKVATAGQLGRSLALNSMSANAAVLSAGDYFHVVAAGVKELKIVTAPLTSTAGGTGTVAFEPALRNAPSATASLIINNPQAEFRLVSPDAGYRVDLNRFGDISFEAIEAFGP